MTKEKLSDLWETPLWLFDILNKEFRFNLDLCATEDNAKCSEYFNDIFQPIYLTNRLLQAGFMNPPYSNILPFAKKAWELSESMAVVCLLKVDPSTKWWAVFWDYNTHQPKAGCNVRFLNKRVKFDPPPKETLEDYLENGSDKDKKLARNLLDGKITTPAFPSAIVIMDRRVYD